MTSCGLNIKSVEKYLFILFIIILILFPIWAFDLSYALDEEGCLTCHQYPGLVMFDKKAGIKVLHIDEEEYLKSEHGKVDCRKCHISIIKVPHTGETTVDCTKECHLTNKEKKIVDSYDLTRLHKKEQSYIKTLRDESSCRECHPVYSHSENNLVRAFLNMHMGFMLCEVCHIKRDKFRNLSYEWMDSENAQFVGKPFGSYFNPKTRKAKKSENFISRISVYATEKGRKRSLMNIWDQKKAKEYLSEKENLKGDVKEQRLRYFHRDINRKEISVACDECHSSNSILDFKQLGFDQKKAKNLTSINIKGLVTKYNTFYLPDLLRK